MKARNERATCRPLRQDKELEAAAGHITYEIRMLVESTRCLPYGFTSPAVDSTKNMAIESFLLHFRNLRAFLCPNLQKWDDDDIVASDFWGSPRPEDVGDARVLVGRKKKIDRLLAHLSYSRQEYVDRGDKSWPDDEMVVDIRTGFQKFLQKLPPNRREWFFEARTVLDGYQVRSTAGIESMGCTTTVVKTEIINL